jgi:hypothetical protein
MRNILALPLTLAGVIAMCWAPPALAVPIDLDLFGSAGLGSATISSQSTSKPQTSQFTGGFAIGLNPFRFLTIGGLTDYRQVNQRTAADPNSFGNRSGTRWNTISPYVDLNITRALRLRYVHQFLGPYELDNKTAGGLAISYEKPKGFRGEIHICVLRGRERFYKIPGKCLLYGGLFYEKVEFSSEKLGEASAAALANPLVMKHMGVTFGLGF